MRDARLLNGRLLGVGRRGPVEVYTGFSGECYGEVGDDSAERGRHQNADALLVGRVGLDPIRKSNGGGEQFPVGCFLAECVGGNRAQPVPAGLFDKLMVERLFRAEALFDGVLCAQFSDGSARFVGLGVGGQCFAETDGDRVRKFAQPFESGLAAIKAEDAAPHVTDVRGDDRASGVFSDLLKALVKLHETAVAGEMSFRKDHNDGAVDQRLAGFLQGFCERARSVGGVDRNAVGQLEDGLGPFPVDEDIARHDGADRACRCRLEEQGVGIGRVVADQQRTAFAGKVFGAVKSGFIERADEARQQESREGSGQLTAGDGGRYGGDERGDQNTVTGAETQYFGQQQEKTRRGDHGAKAEEAAGAKNFAASGRRNSLL